MGTPLPALAVQPPPQPNILDQLQKAQSIRSMLLGQQQMAANLQGTQFENAQRQQALAAQQQVVAAQHDPEWNPADPDTTVKILNRYNVPVQVQGTVMKGILETQSMLRGASSQTLESITAAHSFMDDQIQAAKNAPEDVREKTYQSALQNIKQYGFQLPPGPARQQFLQELSQAPPIYDQKYIDREHALLRTSASLTKDALEKAQTAEATARATQATQEGNLAFAKIPGVQAESAIQQQQAGLSPQQRALAGNLFYGAAAGDPQARQALNLETEQKIAAAQAGVIGAPEALRGVAPHLVLPATSEATKADQAFSQAKQAGDEMQSMVALAKSGNKIAYAYSPVTGVLQINVAGQIKRMNMPEIESYGGAGSAADRVKGWFGKQTSGASIPANVLSDMASVSQMVTNGAQQKYQRDLAGINSRYGSKFTPMSSGGEGGQVTVTDPKGGVHTFPDQASADRFRKLAGIQ